jgi:lysophospholipase L1-like esterase
MSLVSLRRHGLLTGCLVAWLATAASAQDQKPATKTSRAPSAALASIEDDPQLPRVLLIGDSISIGYTLAVREALKDKANVHRIPTNGGPTTNGLKNIDKWLGEKKWDVIHFNWGLHDLKFVDEKGELTNALTGKHQIPLEQYEKNLRQLTERLKKTDAKLIWCSTTPVPEGAGGRTKGDDVKYNEVAAKVMQDFGVTTNDLYAFALPQLKEIQLKENVHFSPEGSKVLAEQVAKTILAALEK